MSIISIINTPSQIFGSTSWFRNRFFVNFGYIQDEQKSGDLVYSQSPMVSTPMSENPSLKKYFKQISNQYSLGSCSANATADSFEAQIAQRNNLDPSQVQDLSRLFIYWNARNLSNPPTYDKDSGSQIRLAFDSMARYGAPYEAIYPYEISKVNERPTILAYREAIKNRINKFYRISVNGQERIGQIKQALCSGCPVVFGTLVANNFMNYSGGSIITNPGGWYVGGHALCCVGWSEAKQAFEVRNSWGEGWGDQGYCWMDKNYLAADITTDIWVATM